MNILEACYHEEIFKPWFKSPETFEAWFAFLAAMFALPMTEKQLATYQKHTGRTEPPTEAQSEAWLIIGRRGGKSFVMALVAVFLACFFDYRKFLAPGERATVMVIAADRRQARVVIRYVRAMLQEIPTLAAMVERETSDTFDLENQVTIEVGTASFRSTRGYTYAAVLADEIAFWRTDDAAEPDYAILDAIRPGMATVPTSMLLCASSPYARKGALWDAFKNFYGKSDAPLIWKASTRDMNPTVPQAVIDRAMERDHASASAEYGAEFRSDIEAFVSLEVVEACVSPGIYEKPYEHRFRYRAFVDPSGGSNDGFTLSITHREEEKIIQDVMRERKPPFSPEAVIKEFCETLRIYGISTVYGDRYGGEFPREHFRKNGIGYTVSTKVKSDLYVDLLPNLNSGSVELLDIPRMVNQLVGLERRVSRSGRESIDHPIGGHDDQANALAGAVHLWSQSRAPATAMFGVYGMCRK